MKNRDQTNGVSAPGRICLFGEHQDYLGLPVIALAISKRITIQGRKRDDSRMVIEMPDIHDSEELNIAEVYPYTKKRDYFRSGVHVLKKAGYTFSHGLTCEVRGNIPINAGTSSSSALVVAWIYWLAQMSDQKKSLAPEETARLAHQAEVLEFHEPGGMMDHYTSAVGGLIYLESVPRMKIQSLPNQLGSFVLGYSGDPKDTTGVLSKSRINAEKLLRDMRNSNPDVTLHHLDRSESSEWRTILTPDQMVLLDGILETRDLTRAGLDLFQSEDFSEEQFGMLMQRHHEILRDVIGVSTPKLDLMIQTALDAGALGGKLNGSGGGGCMFAYAPENPAKVRDKLEKIGFHAWIIQGDSGVGNINN